MYVQLYHNFWFHTFFFRIKYDQEQASLEPKEEEISDARKPSLRGIRVNESFDCEEEEESRDGITNSSFDSPDIPDAKQRLSVHSAIDIGGRRHSGKTVTFCDRRLSDYTCYARHHDPSKVSERTGIIKPTLKDRRSSDMTGQKSSVADNSDHTGTSW